MDEQDRRQRTVKQVLAVKRRQLQRIHAEIARLNRQQVQLQAKLTQLSQDGARNDKAYAQLETRCGHMSQREFQEVRTLLGELRIAEQKLREQAAQTTAELTQVKQDNLLQKTDLRRAMGSIEKLNHFLDALGARHAKA